MKYSLAIALLLLGTTALPAAEWPPTIDPSKDSTINGRAMETFLHGVKPEWGYAAPQEDAFVVVHPKTDRENAPLYVVLHSAGHDVFSAANCTKTVGNHDIYRSPDDHYALYLDCRKNMGDWWWGGMHRGDKGLIAKNSGGDTVPVEKRVMDTVAWAIERYKIDPNRVYLSGNSMGGSGTLGIGMRHGDVFAAIVANVPAGVEHVAERLFFPPKSIPRGVTLPDPPICIDYSAQNDSWSVGHDRFARAMNDRRYPFIFYWGPFGHGNNSAKIMEVNDLIDSFDWLSVKKNEAYPVFTNASTNSKLPWPADLNSSDAGQINAFFRWKTLQDTAQEFGVSLYLVSVEDLKTKFEMPDKAGADVTLRRLQNFKLKPGASFRWNFGSAQGEGKVDAQGLITVVGLTITNTPATLRILPGEKPGSAAHEPDSRLHADGKGWRLDKARITDPERPRVLLIGDSILNGYLKGVVAALKGKAYVDAWVNPHWQSEGTNKLLADVLDNNGPYDVVHFNMGLHGWTEGRIVAGTFEPLTKAYVEVLKTKLPETKLIWASSTPVTAKGNPAELEPEINPIIVEHNRMAAKVMEEAGVPVNDFYALLEKKRDLAKGDRFHWTGPAYQLLSKKAADSILEALAQDAKESHPSTHAEVRLASWWFARHAEKIAEIEKANDPKVDKKIELLMVGDSITNNFDKGGPGEPVWDKHFAPLNALNLGFGGDRTNHVLWRLDHLPALKEAPKAASLMIGTNNICWGSDQPKQAADGVQAIAKKLNSMYPEMKILVLGVFPRRPNLDHPHRKQIIELNSYLPDLLKDIPNVTFMDIGPKFLDEKGFLSKEMMPDTTHPSERAHEIWAEAIVPTLKTMMGK